MFSLHLSLFFCAIVSIASRTLVPFDVRIDHYKFDTSKDLVLSKTQPRLSWKIPHNLQRNVRQVAYQIQMKSLDEQWDSNRIDSSQSIHVDFLKGKQLKSSTHYQLRLRVWTTASEEGSSWTQWLNFRTSIFNLHEFLIANDDVHWIGSTQIYMNELRKEFNVSIASPIRSATLTISGIGYYELYVNGQSVDPSRKLDPGWTTYEKRTLFVSYDLTKNIKV